MSGTTTTPFASPPAPGEKKRVPGPRTLSPLGSAPTIARDTEGFALKMWQRYGDIVHIRFLLWPGYLLYLVNKVTSEHAARRVSTRDVSAWKKRFPSGILPLEVVNCVLHREAD